MASREESTLPDQDLSAFVLNNKLVAMRKDVLFAKTQLCQDLIRRIKVLKNKKGSDHCMAKYNRRIGRFEEEIRFIRTVPAHEVAKLSLVHCGNSAQSPVSGDKISVDERAMRKLVTTPRIVKSVEEFRKEHPKWALEVPFLLQRLGLQYRSKSNAKKSANICGSDHDDIRKQLLDGTYGSDSGRESDKEVGINCTISGSDVSEHGLVDYSTIPMRKKSDRIIMKKTGGELNKKSKLRSLKTYDSESTPGLNKERDLNGINESNDIHETLSLNDYNETEYSKRHSVGKDTMNIKKRKMKKKEASGENPNSISTTAKSLAKKEARSKKLSLISKQTDAKNRTPKMKKKTAAAKSREKLAKLLKEIGSDEESQTNNSVQPELLGLAGTSGQIGEPKKMPKLTEGRFGDMEVRRIIVNDLSNGTAEAIEFSVDATRTKKDTLNSMKSKTTFKPPSSFFIGGEDAEDNNVGETADFDPGLEEETALKLKSEFLPCLSKSGKAEKIIRKFNDKKSSVSDFSKIGAESMKVQEASLHPSWEAKRKLKLATNTKPAGKRTKFSD